MNEYLNVRTFAYALLKTWFRSQSLNQAVATIATYVRPGQSCEF